MAAEKIKEFSVFSRAFNFFNKLRYFHGIFMGWGTQ
jgi:hypothetical protein